MSLEVILGIVVVGIIVLSFLLGLLPKREPKEKYFNCSRCGEFSQHNSRTIEAWCNKKTNFFVRLATQSGLNPVPSKNCSGQVITIRREDRLVVLVLFFLSY